jgi:hypothetical protein
MINLMLMIVLFAWQYYSTMKLSQDEFLFRKGEEADEFYVLLDVSASGSSVSIIVGTGISSCWYFVLLK